MNNQTTNAEVNLNELTSRLKKEDMRNKNLTKRFKIFYFVFGILYALVYIFEYFFNESDPMGSTDIISGTCYVLAWLIFALLFRKANKDYSQVDYSLPTILMLQKAVKRYKLFQPRLIIAIGAALLIDIASSLRKVEMPITKEVINDIVLFQIIFVSAIMIGVVAGIIIWHNRQKPIRDNALALIEELEN
nr:hypothetical protein [uncultured Carboxylicivirga sp.]